MVFGVCVLNCVRLLFYYFFGSVHFFVIIQFKHFCNIQLKVLIYKYRQQLNKLNS